MTVGVSSNEVNLIGVNLRRKNVGVSSNEIGLVGCELRLPKKEKVRLLRSPHIIHDNLPTCFGSSAALRWCLSIRNMKKRA